MKGDQIMKVLLNKGSMTLYAEGPGEMTEVSKVDASHVNVKVMPDKLTASVTGADMHMWGFLEEFARVATEVEMEVKLY